MSITADSIIQDVIRTYPQTAPIFDRYGLDDCCRGLAIREMSLHKGVPLSDLLDEIGSAAEQRQVPS